MMTMTSDDCFLSFEAPRLKIYSKESAHSLTVHIIIIISLFAWGFVSLLQQIFRQFFRQKIIVDKTHAIQYSLFSYVISYWADSLARAYLGDDEVTILSITTISYLYTCMSYYTWFLGELFLNHSQKLLYSAAQCLIFTFVSDTVFHYYPLMSVFALLVIPVLDIIKIFTGSSRLKFDNHLYFGYHLPFLLNILYFSLYDKARFVTFRDSIFRLPILPPVAQMFVVGFIVLTFAILPMLINKQKALRRAKRVYVSADDLKPEEECPICTQAFVLNNENKEITQSKIIKIDCNHLYHEECLDKWIKVKPECPMCKRFLVI